MAWQNQVGGIAVKVTIWLDPDGYVRFLSESDYWGSLGDVASISLSTRRGVRIVSDTNIAQITIHASSGNGIGAGSRFVLVPRKHY